MRTRATLSRAVCLLLVLNAIALAPVGATRPLTERAHGHDEPVPDPALIIDAPKAGKLDPLLEDVALPAVPNHVSAWTTEEVATFTAEGLSVIENREGLRVVEDQTDSGDRSRIAAFDAITDGGVEVIGLAFLDEAEIRELEAMQADTSPRVLGPQVVSAHYQDKSHYHYFFRCSWVYNQGGTYGITIHICSTDFGDIQNAGTAVAAAMTIPARNPWLAWITGVAVYYGMGTCKDANGHCRISMSDYRAVCGWIQYIPLTGQVAYYGYCSGSSNYGYALRSGGGLYYIRL